jgi:hypothetical protein
MLRPTPCLTLRAAGPSELLSDPQAHHLVNEGGAPIVVAVPHDLPCRRPRN